jgi:hypothetical protein
MQTPLPQAADPAQVIVIRLPGQWPAQADLLGWCQDMGPATAVLLVLAGAVYLALGWHLFRMLVMLNAALLGAFLGALIGERLDSVAACAFFGGFTAAAVAWPLMDYAVSIMGAVVGGVLGASIWCIAGQEPAMAWAGAMTGMVAFGMLSFILFRGSVIMFTSLQGAFMLIFGVLGLLCKYQAIAPAVAKGLAVHPMVLPAAVFVPALVGLLFQQSQLPPPEPKKAAAK